MTVWEALGAVAGFLSMCALLGWWCQWVLVSYGLVKASYWLITLSYTLINFAMPQKLRWILILSLLILTIGVRFNFN